MFLKVILMCCAALFMEGSSGDGWGDADMQVTVRKGVKICFQLTLKGQGLDVEDPMGGRRRSVFDVAFENILLGYHFLPHIPERVRANPEFWVDGVREFLCTKKRFFSPNLKACFSAIVLALRSGVCVEECVLGKQWRDTDLCRFVYHEGKICKWSVVPARTCARPSFRDRVSLVFCGERYALEGTIYQRNEGFAPSPVAEDSVFYYKRLMRREPNPRMTLSSFRSVCVPTYKDLLDPNCVSYYDVGVIYFPERGEACGALFSCHGYYSPSGRDGASFTQDLRQEFLQAYKLIDPDLAKYKNVPVLRRDEVRSAVCYRRLMSSAFLERFLKIAAKKWDLPSFRYQNDGVWGGLTQGHLRSICRNWLGFMQLLWGVVEAADIDRMLRKSLKKTVLLFVSGEVVALRGRAYRFESARDDEYTLFRYANRN